ncbi:MAG: hypothetical protein N2C14_30340 [Planctomycetales bacterium]
MAKRKKTRKKPRPNDLSICMGEVRNADAMRQSCEIDAAADRQWFDDHPREERRIRPPSLRETVASGLPPGTCVLVRRGPCGSQIRMFLDPPKG